MIPPDLLEEQAREVVKAPPEWRAYCWEWLGDGDKGVLAVTGKVAPLRTRGPNKGAPNWRKADPATKRTAYLTQAEVAAWREAWSQRTGLCHHCTGAGKRPVAFCTSGTVYHPCRHCDGTGHINRQGQPIADDRQPDIFDTNA